MTSWAALTWNRIEREASQDSTVVLPIGCVETQGPHTPVGLEFHLAQRVADEIAARLDGLALPCIPYGNSDSFRNLPGTIFVRPEILAGLYEDVLRSIVRAGFGNILCVVTHVPNQPIIERAARTIRDESGVRVVWLNPGTLAASMVQDYFADAQTVRGHGAEPGSSLARYLLNTEIPGDAVPETPPNYLDGLEVSGHVLGVEGVPVGYPLNWEELFPSTGGYGDATCGSAEIGRLVFERIVESGVKVAKAVSRARSTSVASARPPD